MITFSLSEGQGVESVELRWIYANVIAPGEAALMATTLFLLTGAYMILLRTPSAGYGMAHDGSVGRAGTTDALGPRPPAY